MIICRFKYVVSICVESSRRGIGAIDLWSDRRLRSPRTVVGHQKCEFMSCRLPENGTALWGPSRGRRRSDHPQPLQAACLHSALHVRRKIISEITMGLTNYFENLSCDIGLHQA